MIPSNNSLQHFFFLFSNAKIETGDLIDGPEEADHCRLPPSLNAVQSYANWILTRPFPIFFHSLTEGKLAAPIYTRHNDLLPLCMPPSVVQVIPSPPPASLTTPQMKHELTEALMRTMAHVLEAGIMHVCTGRLYHGAQGVLIVASCQF